MNLNPLNDTNENPPDINKGELDALNILSNSFNELKYDLKDGDSVIPIDKTLEDCKELTKGEVYTIKTIKLSDLGDMNVWVIYLNEKGTRNPYLANQFKPIK